VYAGKKYVCELAAMPVHMLTQEELATLLLFQVDVQYTAVFRIRIRNILGFPDRKFLGFTDPDP
jgi:hypothetical protein